MTADGPLPETRQSAFRATVEADPDLVREETLCGDPHLVAPVIVAEEGVDSRRSLCPFEELAFAAPTFNGRPLTATHPRDDGGEPVTATTPAALAEYGIGQFLNATPDVEARRLTGEIWLNLAEVDRLVDTKAETGVDAMTARDRLQDGETVGISAGYRVVTVPEAGQYAGTEYESKIAMLRPDHVSVEPWATTGDRGGFGPVTLQDEQASAATPAGDHFAAARNEAIAKLRSDDTAGFQLATINDDETVGAKIATRELPVDGSVGSLNMLLAATFQVASKYDRSVEDILGRVADYHDLAETEVHRNTAGSDA